MIIVSFIHFDNSLFWPLYGYIPNAKTFLFSYVRMKKIPISSWKISKKKTSFCGVNCILARPDDTSSRSLAFRPLHHG